MTVGRKSSANLTPAAKQDAQRRAASAQGRGLGNRETAKLVGVAVSTIVAWRRDDAYRALIAAAEQRLSHDEPESISLLRRALDDPSVNANQITAAKALLAAVPEEVPEAAPGVTVVQMQFDPALRKIIEDKTRENDALRRQIRSLEEQLLPGYDDLQALRRDGLAPEPELQ